MFEAKCSDCHKSTTIPFEPTKGKPVYCKTCFSKHRTTRRGTPSGPITFDMKNAWAIRGNKWQGRKVEHRSVFKKA